jgi:hypothetical protein
MGEIDPPPAGDAVAHPRAANRVVRSSMPATTAAPSYPAFQGRAACGPTAIYGDPVVGRNSRCLWAPCRAAIARMPCKGLQMRFDETTAAFFYWRPLTRDPRRAFHPAFSPLLVLHSCTSGGAYRRASENRHLQAHSEPRQLRGSVSTFFRPALRINQNQSNESRAHDLSVDHRRYSSATRVMGVRSRAERSRGPLRCLCAAP